ncbi:FprA family A-type flavoprotein [Methanothermococcus okinawensis]|uniref:Flavodoxin/nitric oxide synthase n=1 Tax=Methanothermococcus okinawensis (strain DSM 14208 / JCM 11175 / IH1) TaxID=647113 RepID=F8AKU7_METOI|nr:FprA family A-type flavoprotein [Methanothermococcus okinawensis]AEH07569.1 flavodoxin/nitric oxide synthase [Methanothermococcus okinawensis IH1]
MVVKIKEGVYWVGSVDWEVREFHGYETSKGSSYNSYIIKDEKNVLVDSAKHYMFEELIDGIKSVIDPKDIDYIVVNHAEKDHSGCIGKLVKLTGAKIITNEKGKEDLELQFNTEGWEFIIVDTGDEINIGKRTLKFIRTPMLHWPDNMVTYCIEDKILFSNDAFGQHVATSERFDYEVENIGELFEDAKEYFANILLPYKMLIPNTVNALKDLDIEYICPSHGVIWKEHIDEILNKYVEWSSEECKNKAVIAYSTMYNSTKKIAHAIGNGLSESGVEVKIYNISNTPMNTIMREILDAKYVLIGSPTLNSNVYPPVAMFLAYMEGLNPADGKIAAAFGSYGWMEIATDIIKKSFEKLNFKIVEDECLKCRFVPKEDYLKMCYEFGKKLSKIN